MDNEMIIKKISLVTILLLLMLFACQPGEQTVSEVSEIVTIPAADDTPTATEPPVQPTPIPTNTVVPTSTPTSVPTLGVGSTMINPADDASLVYVPEGEFLMGSDDADAMIREKPLHTVYLGAFWIYQFEVTNSQFAAFVEATGYQTTAEEIGRSSVYQSGRWDMVAGATWIAPKGPGSDLNEKGNYPVGHISWNDASTYCQWAGGRLPTEAEWEKAARGTDGRKYPWGNQEPECALTNFFGCGGDASQVGSYPEGASIYGVMDMAGNLWEVVQDWYLEDYYSNSPDNNPTGPESGTFHVLRGGSYADYGQFITTTMRHSVHPTDTDIIFGFRCVVQP